MLGHTLTDKAFGESFHEFDSVLIQLGEALIAGDSFQPHNILPMAPVVEELFRHLAVIQSRPML